MNLVPVLALTLVLQPAPTPPSTAFVPQPTLEATAPAPKRSIGWMFAAGLGMAAIGAGIGGLLADRVNQRQFNDFTDAKNIPAVNTGMAIGGVVGLIPGLLLGNEARDESQSTARDVILLLDAVGALTLGFGYTQTHKSRT